MKNLKTMILVALVAMFVGTVNAAPNFNPCSTEESARFGASHVIVVDASDLAASAGASTNVLVTFTNTVTAPVSLRFKCYVLERAFDSAPAVYTNKANTNDFKVSIGTYTNGAVATSTNKWIDGLQVAQDQTPTVYGSYGAALTVTVAATGSATTVTSPNWMDAQTSDVPILITFQPNATTATNVFGNLVKGRVRVYFEAVGKNLTR